MNFKKYSMMVAIPTYSIPVVNEWFHEYVMESGIYNTVRSDHSTIITIKSNDQHKSALRFPIIAPGFMNAKKVKPVALNMRFQWDDTENDVITMVRSQDKPILKMIGDKIDKPLSKSYDIDNYRIVADALVDSILHENTHLREAIEKAYESKVPYFDEIRPSAKIRTSTTIKYNHGDAVVNGWVLLENSKEDVKVGYILNLALFGQYFYECQHGMIHDLKDFDTSITLVYNKESDDIGLDKYTNAKDTWLGKSKEDSSDICRCPKCNSDNVGCCYRTNAYVTKSCYNCGFQMSGEPSAVFIKWNKLLDKDL